MQIIHNAQCKVNNSQWGSFPHTKLPNYQITKLLAMTLVEILIAIFVLGVGILSITTLMTRNLSTTQRVHTQNTALILAREGMEMLYNYRDTNTILWYERNCGHITLEWEGEDQTVTCDAYIGSGETRYRTIDGSAAEEKKISLVWLPVQNDDFASLRSGGRLFVHSHNADNSHYDSYGHQSDGGTATPFARYLVFSGFSDIPAWSAIQGDDIFLVKSVVLYDLGWYTGQISLSSFIASHQ